MIAFVTLLACFSFLALAASTCFLDADLLRASPRAFQNVIAVPAAATLVSTAALVLFFLRRVRGWAMTLVFVLLVLLQAWLVSAIAFSGSPFRYGSSVVGSVMTVARPWLILVLCATLFVAVRRRGPGGAAAGRARADLRCLCPESRAESRRLAARAFLCAAAALLVGLLGTPPSGPSTNRFGLASFPPNSSRLSRYSWPSPYPPVLHEYNSLGYRDVEPGPVDPAKVRILVVGDSFIWGAGIPTNAETLPAQLRRALAERRPGRYDVTSAAYPAYGFNGYIQTIKALYPLLRPQVVVIGYLDDNDHDPMDTQAILDRTPTNPVIKRIVANVGIRQYVHGAVRNALWQQDEATAQRLLPQAQRQVDDLQAFASARGIQLVLIDYLGGIPSRRLRLAPGVVRFSLPPELRYTGVMNENWYHGDMHPRPPLNRWIAGQLAELLDAPERR